MLGAAGGGILRGFPPSLRRAGLASASAAAAAAGRGPPAAVSSCWVFRPTVRAAAGAAVPQLGSAGGSLWFSSMTASRTGGGKDEDAFEGGPARETGRGRGVMSGHPLPPRTVPDDILGFSCRTYMSGDSDERYPNVHGVHPAEFKVELTVSVPLLGLSPAEEERLIQIVGPRYKASRQTLRLVSDRFPNRIDNKRYLVHLLENILVEARNVEGEDEAG